MVLICYVIKCHRQWAPSLLQKNFNVLAVLVENRNCNLTNPFGEWCVWRVLYGYFYFFYLNTMICSSPTYSRKKLGTRNRIMEYCEWVITKNAFCGQANNILSWLYCQQKSLLNTSENAREHLAFSIFCWESRSTVARVMKQIN